MLKLMLKLSNLDFKENIYDKSHLQLREKLESIVFTTTR